MARAIFYVFDQRFRFVQSFQDSLYYLKVCSLIVSANVVNLTYFTFMDNQVDCFAMVGYVQPVSDILTAVSYTQMTLPTTPSV